MARSKPPEPKLSGELRPVHTIDVRPGARDGQVLLTLRWADDQLFCSLTNAQAAALADLLIDVGDLEVEDEPDQHDDEPDDEPTTTPEPAPV
jgi:hypothetical protein